MRTIVVALAAAWSSGCVQFTWTNAHRGRPLGAERVEWALDARPDLTTALAELGAPHVVRRVEGPDDSDLGTELLWVWRRAEGFNLSGSVPFDNGGSASVQFGQSNTDFEGLRLAFDANGLFVRGTSGVVAREEPGLDLPL
ncbi:hypothetical protein [Planctomycetes bacterium Pla163]|uniref:hypothetical protein n=1 Tax=Rohdeia mirabilis TaxID=2528008 RepID=UPI0011A87446